MTTLSRIYLNPHKRGGRKLLGNPEAMHAAVESAFPPNRDRSKGRVLWRVDNHRTEYVLYVVAPEKPELTHISEQAGWDSMTGDHADYGRFLDSLMKGQRWRFETVINPIKNISPGPGVRGKRVPIVGADAQVDWLAERSGKLGFKICEFVSPEDPKFSLGLDATVMKQELLDFKKKPESNRRVRIKAVRVAGHLEVTDAGLLRRTLASGIGRGRAYGCGLMTLAKP